MWSLLATIIPAPWRGAAISVLVLAATAFCGWAIWSTADTIGDARELKVTDNINAKGTTDADAVAKGEFAVRDCRASGRVWNMARGACVDR